MWDLESTGWYGNHLEGTEAWKEMHCICVLGHTGSVIPDQFMTDRILNEESI